MSEQILEQVTEAIRQMQKAGAKVKEIRVDTKTLDMLWFYMAQKQVRNVATTRRDPYSYLEIYDVHIGEAE